MPKGARKSPLVAVDTNVLLDRANDDELVIDPAGGLPLQDRAPVLLND
jgi:hypothetical protein